ncbi:MAG: helix-turn-helix transcriptional regulator [Proteobacteria bacterium]|nr:helix-turn-helix transcriptional regulator [Pseudomonadota bacterium]
MSSMPRKGVEEELLPKRNVGKSRKKYGKPINKFNKPCNKAGRPRKWEWAHTLWVRELVNVKGLSHRKAAEITGIPNSTISKMVNPDKYPRFAFTSCKKKSKK